MAEYTGFNDYDGNKIWSDSLIEYHDGAGIIPVIIKSPIVKNNEEWGFNVFSDFRPLRIWADKYVSVLETHVES